MKEKTYVEDVDRSMYDFRNEDKDAYKVKEGLNPAIVEQISNEKHDPEWMKEFRMKSLEIFNNSTMPDEWGPSIEGLDMDNIVTYVRPNTHMAAKWSEVPEEIIKVFNIISISVFTHSTYMLNCKPYKNNEYYKKDRKTAPI